MMKHLKYFGIGLLIILASITMVNVILLAGFYPGYVGLPLAGVMSYFLARAIYE